MVDIAATLIHWYAENKRELPWRETTDPYRIWISEIILQQTRVVQGLEYFNRFMLRFPDVRALAEAPGDEVMKYWQGLGYYVIRTFTIRRLWISEPYNVRRKSPFVYIVRYGKIVWHWLPAKLKNYR